ncbi:unnamed protein product, partial [Medioppia subpectinata]
MYFLKKPPGRQENQTLLNESAVKYVNYTNEESPEDDTDLKRNISKSVNHNWV